MLPSEVPRLAIDSAVRVFPCIWKPLFLRLLSRDGALSQEGSLKKERHFQTPGNTLTAKSVVSFGTTESNITGRKNK